MLAIVLALLLADGCGDLCRSEAMEHYARLFAEAGYGRMQNERAGFLLRERDGGLTFAPWKNGDFARASYSGAIPSNAIALVHTHPMTHSSLPSARDRAEARRLGMPVVVVSRDGFSAARPDGAVVWLSEARTPGRASGSRRGPAFRRTSLPR